MTLKQLRDFIILKCNVEGVAISHADDGLINELINQALYDFSGNTRILRERKSLTTAGSYTEYALPSDCEEVVRVEFDSAKIGEINFQHLPGFSVSVSESAVWS